jgi:hypothetical protein
VSGNEQIPVRGRDLLSNNDKRSQRKEAQEVMSSRSNSTNRTDDRQSIIDDIEEWNRLTNIPLTGWSEATVAEFCAATQRLILAARSHLLDAAQPLLALKEKILKCFRVRCGLLPPPAPTVPELEDAWTLCAGHLDVLRQVILSETEDRPSRTRQRAKGTAGRRGYPAKGLNYARSLRRRNPKMKLTTIRARCVAKFGTDHVPATAGGFRSWLSRDRRTQ